MIERLEHANLCVHDIDAVIRFLMTAFPDFTIRKDTTDTDGSRWVHVGNDETYIALDQAKAQELKRGTPYKGRPGLNHLGYEVDDLEALHADFARPDITIQRFRTSIPIASVPISTILTGMTGSSCSIFQTIPPSDMIMNCRIDDCGLTSRSAGPLAGGASRRPLAAGYLGSLGPTGVDIA